MKQVLMDGRGKIQIVEVPAPTPGPGEVIVATAYSVVSSGTEVAAIRTQSSGVLGKALTRPGQVKKLAAKAVKEGIGVAQQSVSDWLARWRPIGYSLSGIITEVGSEVSGLRVGDRVACSGAEYAHHAEQVAVPFRLAVPIPDSVGLKDAAFAPVSAIAMQAIRRSKVSIGETVSVIGLGLIGLLCCQILQRVGCRVVGYDPDTKRCEIALALGCKVAVGDEEALESEIRELTASLGTDSVIVCAGTSSDEPVNLSMRIVRDRGRIVVVGDVGMDIDRGQMYRKELDIVMSRSLGPGRYDQVYERQGKDYPPAYVRWTEARNMEACLEVISDGGLDTSALVSMETPIDSAPSAFGELLKDDPPVAVLLRYTVHSQEFPKAATKIVRVSQTLPVTGSIGAGLIGPGNFARAVHLPALKRSKDVVLRGVVARSGHVAEHVARHYGAEYGSTNPNEVFDDPHIHAVWIASTHETHVEFTLKALNANKHVFVEKPLGLTIDGCERVVKAAAESDRVVTVGFNRRFASSSRIVAEHFAHEPGPKNIVYRVSAEALPSDHWLDDVSRGGGRLLGEAVHFFDWMAWFLGEEPRRIFAQNVVGVQKSSSILLEFGGGSIATLIYNVADIPVVSKERIEIFGPTQNAVIDDFHKILLTSQNGRRKSISVRGKGHQEQFDQFLRSLRGEGFHGPTAEDGLRATSCALAALDSVRTGLPAGVDLSS